jgi:biotin carboxyl carrier protein
MAYVVTDGNNDWPVRVETSDEGCPIVVVGERTYRIDAVRPDAGAFSLLVEGRAYEVVLTRREGRHHVQVGGRSYVLEVLDERQKLLRDQRAAMVAEGPAEVSSSMPGRVVTVLVAEGEEVEEGQGVIVLEAMKMENELKAPKAGQVTGVRVEEGDSTEAGQALVVIE